ncbi:hypothetical protein D3C81_2196170 [compost metagenome]
MPVKGDQGQVHLPIGLDFQRMTAHNDAVHPAGAQHVNIFKLFNFVLLGVAEQQLIPVQVGMFLDMAG